MHRFRFLLTIIATLIIGLAPSGARADSVPFSIDESSNYLIIATHRVGTATTEIDTNNFELGANQAPVPATDNFLDGGSTGGPTLAGSVPALPSGIAPFFQGIAGNGNLAVTDPEGTFSLSNVGVYADPDIGIQVAADDPGDSSVNQASNSYFNEPNGFPNTFDTTTQTGNTVGAGSADQSTLIDADGTPGNVGVTYGVDFSNLLSELDAARIAINGLASTGTLDTGGDGVIDSDTLITLSAGLNVFDIDTGGNDFSLNNANLVINGGADSYAIFRLTGDDNMLVSNANVLVGDGGIGMNNVLFFAGNDNNSTTFNFNNTLLNGVAFWSLGNDGQISINNAQGCTQLIADVVTLNDVRLARCAFHPNVVPTPSAALGSAAMLGILGLRRRRRD